MNIFEVRHSQTEPGREPQSQWTAVMGEASLTHLQFPCASPTSGARPMTVQERRRRPDQQESREKLEEQDDPWSFSGPVFGR